MKAKAINWLVKALLAGAAAFALLCLFCFFYYNVPVHYANPDGATEYKWEPGSFYSRGTEGFALGRINNDGFNNLRDHSPGERIDILLMGSSHMEAFNVAQDENTAAVLNTLFAGERYVYNIGTAGHTFLYCVKHLADALDVYAPAWVVIEAADLSFPAAEIEAAAEMAMEHCLGMTCDPVGGLVQIPCIERNAVAAMRALSSTNLSRFLSATRKISFDEVVATMYRTGLDMDEKYRETSHGGLAQIYREQQGR